jgi:hypothetical protein
VRIVNPLDQRPLHYLGAYSRFFAADAGSAGVGRNGSDRRSPIEIIMARAARRISMPMGRAGIEPATLGLREPFGWFGSFRQT